MDIHNNTSSKSNSNDQTVNIGRDTQVDADVPGPSRSDPKSRESVSSQQSPVLIVVELPTWNRVDVTPLDQVETESLRVSLICQARFMVDTVLQVHKYKGPTHSNRMMIVDMVRAIGNIYSRAGMSMTLDKRLILMLNAKPQGDHIQLYSSLKETYSLKDCVRQEELQPNQLPTPCVCFSCITKEINREKCVRQSANTDDFLEYSSLMVTPTE